MFKKNDEMIRIKISEDDAAEVIAALIKRLAKERYVNVNSVECMRYMASLTAFAAELLPVLGDRDEVRRILEERDDG